MSSFIRRAFTVMLALFALAAWAQTPANSKRREVPRMLHSNEEYAEQFEKLDRASHDLEEVIQFFNEEEGRLYQAKKVVDDLQAERIRLQPLAKADKELVDRLFQEQEGRARKQVWLERVISFLRPE